MRNKNIKGSVYRIWVDIEKESEGYSAICINLPGVCSQGSDIIDALENIREAAEGVISEYIHNNEVIPWDKDYYSPHSVYLDVYILHPVK